MKTLLAIIIGLSFTITGCKKDKEVQKQPEVEASKAIKAEVKKKPVQNNIHKLVKGVDFVRLKDGDVIKSKKLNMFFTVKGMNVAPAGKMKPGTGHFHLIINGDHVKKGTLIPFNKKHIHFGKGQSMYSLPVKKGDLKLTLQFADGAHKSYGMEWSKTVNITVE